MSTILYGDGDAIKGDRVACQYRSCSDERIVQGSGGHRAGARNLYTAYCYIVPKLRPKK